jgi:asparagine synthase (glutamine-hydrolysing)
MSAICAIYGFDQAPVPCSAIDRLLDAMQGCGSEAGRWAPETPEAPVALGCRPMRVTPEDVYYHPPIRSSDGQVVLVADARIDNRPELAGSLGISPAVARERSDAEFILAAYQAWGKDCPRRLIGDFTFAIWDQRKRWLFCGRDGMGLRVLFYPVSPQRIALATLPQALFALGDVPARLNQQKVAEALVLLQDPESSFFAGVKRLGPGHTLTARADGIQTERFWSPEPPRNIVLGSDLEYVEAFNAVFDQAVQARVRSTGPVGISLSGGLDSSAVAASAAAQLGDQGRRLYAFHAAPRVGFQVEPGWGFVADESAQVEALAAMYSNLDLRVYRTDGRTPFDSAEQRYRMAGLPPRNPSNLPWYEAIFSMAQAAGITVMLTGDRGNNTISYDGVRSLRDMARRGHWGHVWREAQALARAQRAGRREVLRDQVLLPLLPGWLTSGRAGKHAKQTAAAIADYSAILPEFAVSSGVAERVGAAGTESLSALRAGSVAQRVMGLTSPADSPDLLNGYRPWFGIETRDPTADLRVVEYCLAIPASQYLRGGRTRWLIRRALQGRVPEQVWNRDAYGSQAADWTEWLPAMRRELTAELDRLERSDTARRCLDLTRLRSLLVHWPEPLQRKHRQLYLLLLLRAIMMGNFILWFERTYS